MVKMLTPIYKYLKNRAKNDTDIKWNFEKFLIDKSENITHYESSFLPTAFADMVKTMRLEQFLPKNKNEFSIRI